MTPLRICQVCPTFPPMRCGIGDVTWRLSLALAELGSEVHIVTSRNPDSAQSPILPNGVVLHPIMPAWGWREADLLFKTLADLRPDVVHIQYEAGMYGYRNWGVGLLWHGVHVHSYPIVTTLHELWAPKIRLLSRSKFIQSLTKRGMILAIAGWSGAVLVTNEAYQAEVSSILPARLQGRLHLVRQASPFPSRPTPGFDRNTVRRTLGITDNTSVLGYFGFLRKDKGIELLLQVLEQLVRRSVPAKLLVVGEVHESDAVDYKRSLESLAMQLHVADDIIWLPYLPAQEAINMLSCSDVIALPYLDGVSTRRTSFLATLGLGLPIVTTLGQPIPSWISDAGVTLVHPDVTCLTEGILPLIAGNMPSEERSIQRKLIAQLLGWETIAQDTIQVYQWLHRAADEERDSWDHSN